MNPIITNKTDCVTDQLSAEEHSLYTYSHTDFNAWVINWNAQEISNGETGYILQHVKLVSEISGIPSNDYYEAWETENNCVDRKGARYDDTWSPGFIDWFPDEDFEAAKNSESATVKYDAEVYWVPVGTGAYNEIDGWGEYGAPEAGELKSSKVLNADVEKYYKGDRHRTWDYKAILKSM
ncbi:MAG: hypothetical protein LIP11_16105 [Clostridiales bacterium]|nr:hypothetical protein [Clostridiales bacterium]